MNALIKVIRKNWWDKDFRVFVYYTATALICLGVFAILQLLALIVLTAGA